MRTTLRHLLTPHHTNNYRARILHPAGISILIGLFLLTQSTLSLWRAATVLPGGLVLGYASSITASQTVELTNRERALYGLPALKVSSQLTQAAVAKANHMFSNNYWSHIAPDGTTPWNFIHGAGYEYSVAGENLARDFDDTSSMVQAWMNSPTHKDNIVNSKYSEIGVAVVDGVLDGVETTLVVQMFGKPAKTAISAETSDRGISTAAITEQEPISAKELAEDINDKKVPESVINLTEKEISAQNRVESENLSTARINTLGVTLTSPSGRAIGSIMLSPLTLTKVVATSILILLVGVIAYDAAVIHRKQLTRTIGKNWAHLTLFIFVLLVVLSITQGRVL